MSRFVALLASSALVLTTGCGAVRDELRYPSGAPGRLLDKRTFDASESKQLALLRLTLALAIAARMGEGAVTANDADAFARQLAEAASEINYAAVDAGLAKPNGEVGSDGFALRTCDLKRELGTFPTDYAVKEAACDGYYVNFEANISRIESRIVRAMLTSLPTDRARRFLEQLTKGDLLSAVWSLAKVGGDLAGAFHRGAGVYRSGLENVAAQVAACQPPTTGYDQKNDTVLRAALCLGLNHEDLFVKSDMTGEKLPGRIDPQAFMALFRIIRTSCVALPMTSAVQDAARLIGDRENRRKTCERLRFEPKPRPDALGELKETDVADAMRTQAQLNAQSPATGTEPSTPLPP